MDFNSKTTLDFLKSFAKSMYENTNYEPESAAMYQKAADEGRTVGIVENIKTGPFTKGSIITTIVNNQGVCRNFAGMGNVMLSELGIESEIGMSVKAGHIFLRVQIQQTPYIVDPTNGDVMSEQEFYNVWKIDDAVYTPGFFTSQCPLGVCHNR